MKKYLFGAIILLLVSMSILYGEYRKQSKKMAIQERNITALRSVMEYFKTENGISAAKIQGLELNLNSFKKLYADTYAEAKDLKVKLKNATGVIQYKTVIKYQNKDSIVYIPDVSGKKYQIRDSLISADVITTGDSLIKPGNFIINSISNKTTIVPSIEYKGWWLWKKPKGVYLTIGNTNPFICVTDALYIDLSKK